ncbi:MAG: SpoIVB peptidase [Provencibacterium sp.]|jgi:stage IV sporulation protein B|nr:SpoIVB peptidase [Provencibacterium sp.]
MRKLCKAAAGILSVCILGVLSLAIYTGNSLPDKYYIAEGEQLTIRSPFSIYPEAENTLLPIEAYSVAGNTYSLQLRMLGAVSVKQVQVQVVDRKSVVPCGIPFGIKMFTEGVIVVGMSDVDTPEGLMNPAKQCGIQIGDIVTSINGKRVESNEQVGALVQSSGGVPLNLTVKRDSKTFSALLTPVRSSIDGQYKAGIWVRDSSAGIGTMTYYDPKSGCYAGLGHAVCDVDTQLVMPLYSGEIVRASISGISPGHAGTPGELKGMFVESSAMGTLEINNETGVFGKLYGSYPYHQPVQMAHSYEVEKGPASILCTVEGETPSLFSIQIDRINTSSDAGTRNMVISITDPALLAKTGGIVQGMSGSPILQNGKLVGAITHVFVNDPTRGYAIFAENMDNTLKSVASGGALAS